jgi:hypothetical protein
MWLCSRQNLQLMLKNNSEVKKTAMQTKKPKVSVPKAEPKLKKVPVSSDTPKKTYVYRKDAFKKVLIT